jgi:hypothetical protein
MLASRRGGGGRAVRWGGWLVWALSFAGAVIPGPASEWTNLLGGAWNAPLNWSDHLVPAFGDAVIGLPGSYSITNLGDSTVATLRLQAAGVTLVGPGGLVISNLFTWRAGQIGGPAGAIVDVRGGLSLSGAGAGEVRRLGRNLLNRGVATWDDAASLALGNGVVISNLESGVFAVSAGGAFDDGGGTGEFVNAGLLRKGGADTAVWSTRLVNHGRFEIAAGTVELRRGVQNAGIAQVAEGARLALAAGTHGFGAASVLTGAGGLEVSGGTVTLGGLVELGGPVRFRAGTVNVTGEFRALTNLVSVSGAAVTFSGTYRMISNRLEVTSGTARFDGNGILEPAALTVGPAGRLEGTTPVVVTGPLRLDSSTLPGGGTLIARGGLILAGNASSLSGRTLVNAGAAVWGAGGTAFLSLSSGAVISNLAGATFDLTFDGTLLDSGAAGGFVNDGVFRKSGGTATAQFLPKFSNGGTVEAESGTLRLAGGGNHSGTFRLGAGAGLNLGGNHTFLTNSAVSGAGELRVSSGTANFAGLVDTSGDHVFAGGTANLTGRYVAITNLVAIVGGVANFSGTGPVSPSSLTISNLGVLGGTGLVTVKGPLRWGNGSMRGSGLVVAEGGLELVGSQMSVEGRTVVNAGSAVWGGGGTAFLSLSSGAVITNLAGATFDMSIDGTLLDSGAAGGFVNDGVFRKSGGTATAQFLPKFSNGGTVEAESGTLRLAGGGSHRGIFRLGAGAGLNLGGNHTFLTNSAVSGAGELRVSSGTANFAGLVDTSGDHVFAGGAANLTGRYVAITNLVAIVGGVANFSGTGPVSPTSLTISNLGVLGGTGLVTVKGPLRWGNGSMRGSGLVVAEGGLELVGSQMSVEGRTVVNAGPAVWGGGGTAFLSLSSGAVITNLVGATFDMSIDGTLLDSGAAGGFVNEGVFRKSGGTATAVFVPKFSNGGTVEAESGTLRLAGGGNHSGTFRLGAGAGLNLGGNHTFLTNSVVSGVGELRVSSGTANFAGLVEVTGDHVFAGGTANLTGRYVAMTNQVAIVGGVANFSGTGPVSPSSLTISNLGVLGGTGLVTVKGPLRWGSGSMRGSGLVVAEGGLELVGSQMSVEGRTLVNAGPAVWGGRGNRVPVAVERGSDLEPRRGDVRHEHRRDAARLGRGGRVRERGAVPQERRRGHGGVRAAVPQCRAARNPIGDPPPDRGTDADTRQPHAGRRQPGESAAGPNSGRAVERRRAHRGDGDQHRVDPARGRRGAAGVRRRVLAGGRRQPRGPADRGGGGGPSGPARDQQHRDPGRQAGGDAPGVRRAGAQLGVRDSPLWRADRRFR